MVRIFRLTEAFEMVNSYRNIVRREGYTTMRAAEEYSLVDVVGVVGRLLWGSRVGGRGTPCPPFPSCSAARVRRVEKFPPPNICGRMK